MLQEIVRLKQEEEDRKLALSLQEEQSTTAPPSATDPFASTLDAGRTYSAPQVRFVACSKSKSMPCTHTSSFPSCIGPVQEREHVCASVCVTVSGFEIACVIGFVAHLGPSMHLSICNPTSLFWMHPGW